MKKIFVLFCISMLTATTSFGQISIEAKVLSGITKRSVVQKDRRYFSMTNRYESGLALQSGATVNYKLPLSFTVRISSGVYYTRLSDRHLWVGRRVDNINKNMLTFPLEVEFQTISPKTLLSIGAELNMDTKKYKPNPYFDISKTFWSLNIGIKQQLFNRFFIGIEAKSDLQPFEYSNYHQGNRHVDHVTAHYHYSILGGIYYQIFTFNN